MAQSRPLRNEQVDEQSKQKGGYMKAKKPVAKKPVAKKKAAAKKKMK